MWIDVGTGHRIELIQVQQGQVTKFLWEHDAQQPYDVPRHVIANADGQKWTLVSEDPLTLTPSVHCDRSRGGCGMHGFISNGRYS